MAEYKLQLARYVREYVNISVEAEHETDAVLQGHKLIEGDDLDWQSDEFGEPSEEYVHVLDAATDDD